MTGFSRVGATLVISTFMYLGMGYDKSVHNNKILKAQLIVDQYKSKLHFPNGWNRANNYALNAEDVTFFRAIFQW